MDNILALEHKIKALLEELWPLNRSLTGIDTLKSLQILSSNCPDLEIKKIKSGTKVYDWVIPPVWEVKDAYICDLKGNKIVDWKINNLHLYGYSMPFIGVVSKSELQGHLTFLEDNPDAIPYVTSYYDRSWGFCISYNQFLSMIDEEYYICIDSTFDDSGEMNFAEAYLPGNSEREILLTTYICHPSMANNELSGPILSILLLNHLKTLPLLKYSVRLLIMPETIGAISYINSHSKRLMKHTEFGMVLTCVGDDNKWSFLQSKFGKTTIDELVRELFRRKSIEFTEYTFLDRGSDERQFSGPLINLPFVSIMRSKYATYREYHTSLDNLDFISVSGILNSLVFHIEVIENYFELIFPRSVFTCEPKFSNYGLKSGISAVKNYFRNKEILDVLTYCTGELSIIEIARILSLTTNEVKTIVDQLFDLKLITIESYKFQN
jgi:aminopeptidase-like protein